MKKVFLLSLVIFLLAALPAAARGNRAGGYLVLGGDPQRPGGLTAQEGQRLGLVPAVCPHDIPGVETQGAHREWVTGTLHAGEAVWGRRIGNWFAIRRITRCGNRVRKGGWRIPPPPHPPTATKPSPPPPSVTVNVTLPSQEQSGWVTASVVAPGPTRYHQVRIGAVGTQVSTPVRLVTGAVTNGNTLSVPQLVETPTGPVVNVGGNTLTLSQYQNQVSQSQNVNTNNNVLNNGSGSASGTGSATGSQTGSNPGP